jgi:hypothetical protein
MVSVPTSVFLISTASITLVLLTILDIARHHSVHVALLGITFGSYIIGGAFLALDGLAVLRSLRRDIHGDEKTSSSRELTDSTDFSVKRFEVLLWLRSGLVLAEFVLVVVFMAFYWNRNVFNVTAGIEWAIGGLFGVYVGSFAADL